MGSTLVVCRPGSALLSLPLHNLPMPLTFFCCPLTLSACTLLISLCPSLFSARPLSRCGTLDDDGERMIACDQCGVWSHTRCNGLPEWEEGEEPPPFVCGTCVAALEYGRGKRHAAAAVTGAAAAAAGGGGGGGGFKAI